MIDRDTERPDGPRDVFDDLLAQVLLHTLLALITAAQKVEHYEIGTEQQHQRQG